MCEVQGARYKMRGTRREVQGARFKVCSTMCEVQGAKFEVRGTIHLQDTTYKTQGISTGTKYKTQGKGQKELGTRHRARGTSRCSKIRGTAYRAQGTRY